MGFVLEQLGLLGLNAREIRVFTSLATFGAQNVTSAAARSGLPRTTVDYILRSLCKQGIVSREKVKGRHLYRVDVGDVADRLEVLETRLRPRKSEQKAVNDEKAGICKDEKVVIDDALFAKYQGDRVAFVLGESADTKTRLEQLTSYLHAIAKNSVKAEVFMGTSMSRLLRDSESWVWPSVRADAMFFVLPRFFLDGVDLLLTRDAVFVGSIGARDVEVVRDMHCLEAYRALVVSAREAGWPFTQPNSSH